MGKVITNIKIKDNPETSVFARNHWIYMESAVKRGRKGLTCFRATSKWQSAWVATDCHGPRSIYFTPIDPPEAIDNSLITHEAILLDVLLLDELGTNQSSLEKNPEVKKFYKHVLEETRDEGLWDGNVNTLYLVIGCRKLFRPFPYTKLIKVGDESPISENFGYRYSLFLNARLTIWLEYKLGGVNMKVEIAHTERFPFELANVPKDIMTACLKWQNKVRSREIIPDCADSSKTKKLTKYKGLWRIKIKRDRGMKKSH